MRNFIRNTPTENKKKFILQVLKIVSDTRASLETIPIIHGELKKIRID